MNLPHEFIVADFDNVEATKAVLKHDIGVILVEPMQSAVNQRLALTKSASVTSI